MFLFHEVAQLLGYVVSGVTGRNVDSREQEYTKTVGSRSA